MADTHRRVDPQLCIEALSNDPEARLLDVRSRAEFLPRHARLAVHLPLGRISITDLEALGIYAEKDPPLFCICASGIRSVQAARQLQRLGFRNVAIVDGGLRSWAAHGLPMDAMPRPAPLARLVLATLLFVFTLSALAVSGYYGLLATTTFGLAMVTVMPWRWVTARARGLVRATLRRRTWRRSRRVVHG
jgi:rhodanese-related sulfurtransferase